MTNTENRNNIDDLVTALSLSDTETNGQPSWWEPTSERNVTLESCNLSDSLYTALDLSDEEDDSSSEDDDISNKLSDEKTVFPPSNEYSTTEEVETNMNYEYDSDLITKSDMLNYSSLSSTESSYDTTSTTADDVSDTGSELNDTNGLTSSFSDLSSSIKLPKKSDDTTQSTSAEDISILELPEKPKNPKKL